MTTSLAPSITHRDPKGRKFVSIVETAYDKADLSEEEAQRVNDTAGLADLIGGFIAENRQPNQFSDEEVESSYGYLSGYAPKPIIEQIKVLREFFPELGLVDEKLAEADFPPNAEGWFAIPRWEKVAPTYGEAVQKVLDLIKQTRDRKFRNYREGQLGSEYLRQHERTAACLKRIGEAQSDHEILVVPAQFGLRHRGRSVRRAREVFTSCEFGLGAFQIVCMLLTHSERLAHYDDLWVDCAGDEFALDADGDFRSAPFFDFGDGCVGFRACWVVRAVQGYGSASGFLPQS